MDLKDIRQEIDKIDDEMLKLFEKRMDLAKEVANEKKKNNTSIINSVREKEIINRLSDKIKKEYQLYLKQLYTSIFDISKAYQSTMLIEESPTVKKILNIMKKGLEDFPIKANVACQGIKGSYSSIATNKIFEISNISYFKDFASVFTAVEKGLCEFGVLPIENSSAGSVKAIYDLMQDRKFTIVASYKLKIDHSLLAKHRIDLSKIKEIISHEQAIAQCSEFLSQFKDVKITSVDNTAVAARMVAQSDRDDIACISSKECADIYGLFALQKGIQDSSNNYTRFIAIAKDLRLFKGANKISIKVDLPHTVGSLNKAMNEFSIRGLNLTKLESRPQPKSIFEFSFYFDFEGDITKDNVLNVIGIIENQAESFDFLGYYEEK